jgi:hypothetical protein
MTSGHDHFEHRTFTAFAFRPRPRPLRLRSRSHPLSIHSRFLPPSYTLSSSIFSDSRRCRIQQYPQHARSHPLSVLPAHQDDWALGRTSMPSSSKGDLPDEKDMLTGTFRGVQGICKHIAFVYKTSCTVATLSAIYPAHLPSSHFSSHLMFSMLLMLPTLMTLSLLPNGPDVDRMDATELTRSPLPSPPSPPSKPFPQPPLHPCAQSADLAHPHPRFTNAPPQAP